MACHGYATAAASYPMYLTPTLVYVLGLGLMRLGLTLASLVATREGLWTCRQIAQLWKLKVLMLVNPASCITHAVDPKCKQHASTESWYVVSDVYTPTAPGLAVIRCACMLAITLPV